MPSHEGVRWNPADLRRAGRPRRTRGFRALMVECELVRIVIRESADQQYIFLREKGGERSFPIVIGVAEAAEINRKAMGTRTMRPLTHDLLRQVVGDLGGAIVGIEVSDLRESTFFANLILQQGDRIIRVDCRPSDAIALALAASVTISVSESVLAQAAAPKDESSGA